LLLGACLAGAAGPVWMSRWPDDASARFAFPDFRLAPGLKAVHADLLRDASQAQWQGPSLETAYQALPQAAAARVLPAGADSAREVVASLGDGARPLVRRRALFAPAGGGVCVFHDPSLFGHAHLFCRGSAARRHTR